MVLNPSFLVYDPKLIMYESKCTSCTRNPKQYALKSGDVYISRLWCLQNGYHGDHAYSFEIGEVDPETKKIITNYTKNHCNVES
jgi:methionine aminopeptidase